jgi:hypothetical protein
MEEAAGPADDAEQPVEAAAAAAAPEQPEAEPDMEEEDSGDDDWETMDVDAIKLPSQAAEEQVPHAGRTHVARAPL